MGKENDTKNEVFGNSTEEYLKYIKLTTMKA
jgi:hypothetical protein